MRKPNRYTQIIERIFLSKYQEGMREVSFKRDEIETVAQELGVVLPKNLGDVIYSFRYRTAFPASILLKAPPGEIWIIRAAGKSQYQFVTIPDQPIAPSPLLAETKIPDATPGLIEKYAFSDEQALLAKLRYNRLIDIFTGVTCYSLQNHLRTTVPNVGQIETDEVYIGVDSQGVHFVFPVQAKGGNDKSSIVQIEQDFALCAHKFSALICRPIAAQFMGPDRIALFAFEQTDEGIRVSTEKHYRLVPPEEVTEQDLQAYRIRTP